MVAFAWFNVDFIRERFSLTITPTNEDSQEIPLFVMQNGKQDYHKDNYLQYQVNYTEFALYQGKRFYMLKPYMQLYNNQGQVVSWINAELLNSDDGNTLIFKGSPSTVSLHQEKAITNARALVISYEVEEQQLIMQGEPQLNYISGSSTLKTEDNFYTIDSQADNILITRKTSRLNGNANMVYKTADEIFQLQAQEIIHNQTKEQIYLYKDVLFIHKPKQTIQRGARELKIQAQEGEYDISGAQLDLSGSIQIIYYTVGKDEELITQADRAIYDLANTEIDLAGNVEIIHNKAGRQQVQAYSDNAKIHKDFIILQGNAQINDRSFKTVADKILYNMQREEWEIQGEGAKDSKEDSSSADDRIEIQVPKQ